MAIDEETRKALNELVDEITALAEALDAAASKLARVLER